eukprot:scpid111471/ scgid14413/ 
MGCPAVGCPNTRNPDVVNNRWRGSKCRGVIEISQFGNLRCEHTRGSSKCVQGQMYSFRFDCGLRGPDSPHDNGLSRFREADRQGISHAIAAAMAMNYLSPNGLAWVTSLMTAIAQQYPELDK